LKIIVPPALALLKVPREKFRADLQANLHVFCAQKNWE